MKQTESLLKMLEGYRAFYAQYSDKESEAYRRDLATTQSPKVMIIACSDSRLRPRTITGSGMGEIFTVTNVANLVPQYEPDPASHHGVSAALEFAVTVLKVEHVIILGHSNCGGIRALLEGMPKRQEVPFSFIEQWMDMARPAAEAVANIEDPDEKLHACEREALKVSLANLHTYPWVAARVEAGDLALHAWHFDIETGMLAAYDPQQKAFAGLLKESAA